MYYFDIRTSVTSDLSPCDCMRFAFTQAHKAMGQHQKGDVGISFPEFSLADKNVGEKLRLHGSKESLEHVRSMIRTAGIIEMGSIAPVPEKHSFVCVCRMRNKGESALRRFVKRGGDESVWKGKRKFFKNTVNLGSILSSGGQVLPSFLIRQEPSEKREGGFSSYGLSSQNSVPFF